MRRKALENAMSATTLHLAVQYATELDAPTRAQVRRWVRAALIGVRAEVRAVAGDLDHRAVADATLTIRFVDVDEARTLNRTFRGKDHATNVLTFAYEAPLLHIEADVAICMPVVVAEAREQHKEWSAHCAHLVMHGTLHACGYDHETANEADAMEAIERTVLARFRIANPYAAERRA